MSVGEGLGLSRPAGSAIPVAVNGKNWFVRLTMGDLAAFEQEVVRRKPNPIELVMGVYDRLVVSNPEMAEALLLRAYEDAKSAATATSEEVNAFMDTFDGMGFILFRAISHEHPNVTREECDDVIHHLLKTDEGRKAQKKLMNSIFASGGMDDLGNSTGPTQDQGAANPSPNGNVENRVGQHRT